MPVPDETYFGERPAGGAILYGEVRTIKEDDTRLELLKCRIDSFLMRQVNALTLKNDDDSLRIWSPFPLTILTFLAIETMGHVIVDVDKVKEENDYEQSKEIVTPVYMLMDRNLSYKPSKKFYEAFEKLHGKDDKKSLKRYSDVIHKYQRNTFNHGYQARGVYLSHLNKESWTIHENEGFIVLNPYLFWELFKTTYDDVFQNVLNGHEPKWRTNALLYVDRLLS